MTCTIWWKAALSISLKGGSFIKRALELTHSFDEWTTFDQVRWNATPITHLMKRRFNEKAFRWKGASMKRHFDEKVLWWEGILMKSCLTRFGHLRNVWYRAAVNWLLVP
jgi:hypothetical protein